jgi:hypothetical protein
MGFCGRFSRAVELSGLLFVTFFAQWLHVVDGVRSTCCKFDDVIHFCCPVTTHQA